MGTVNITERELIVIMAALGFTCKALAGDGAGEGRIQEMEQLRLKLNKEWRPDR